MKYIFFSDDSTLSRRWNSVLIGKKREVIENINLLYSVKNCVVVLNYSKDNLKCEELINILTFNDNLVLLLDRVPEFKKALHYLSLGVRGYGNVIMSKSYLISAIEAVANGQIWMTPDISTTFVKEAENIVDKKRVPKTKVEIQNSIFAYLTKTEEKVAAFIKSGLTNSEISEKMEISINTLKTHIKSIYKKLDVKDRLEFSLLFTKEV